MTQREKEILRRLIKNINTFSAEQRARFWGIAEGMVLMQERK